MLPRPSSPVTMADLAPAPPVLVCPAAKNGKYARYRDKNLEARRQLERECQRTRRARLRQLQEAAYEASTGLPYGG